ncbi:MAG: VCBS repeat-containing protein, partial [Phycisphaerales bacterium]|nr:VCBS repeat-containing protein [Phycisphaerales bacterium]
MSRLCIDEPLKAMGALIIGSALTATATAQCRLGENEVTRSTTAVPYAIDSADVNHDGLIDVATLDYIGENLSVFLQLPGGSLANATMYPVGPELANLILVDLDGDTFADALAIDYATETVAVIINDGTGGFGTPVNYAAGSKVRELAVGDIDDDGDLDVIVGNDNPGTITLLSNDGAGVLSILATLPAVNSSSNINCIALADMEGDGDLDIFVGGDIDGFHLHEQTTSPTTFVRHDFDFGFFAAGGEYVDTGDIDDDGDVDVVFAANDRTSVAINDGDGLTWTHVPLIRYPLGEDFGAGVSDLIDLDDDGDLDYMQTGRDAALAVIRRNDGGGNFAAPSAHRFGLSAYGVTALDLGNDGETDLVGTRPDHDSIVVLRPSVDGEFANPAALTARNGLEVAVDDIDNDGDPDIVAACGGTNWSTVLLNEGDGFRYSPTTMTSSAGAQTVDIGDLDDDGFKDIMIGHGGSASYVHWNGGAFTFFNNTTILFGSFGSAEQVEIGDFNGDGLNDIAAARSTSTAGERFAIRINTGARTFNTLLHQSLASDGTAIALADFDADGDL